MKCPSIVKYYTEIDTIKYSILNCSQILGLCIENLHDPSTFLGLPTENKCTLDEYFDSKMVFFVFFLKIVKNGSN